MRLRAAHAALVPHYNHTTRRFVKNTNHQCLYYYAIDACAVTGLNRGTAFPSMEIISPKSWIDLINKGQEPVQSWHW